MYKGIRRLNIEENINKYKIILNQLKEFKHDIILNIKETKELIRDLKQLGVNRMKFLKVCDDEKRAHNKLIEIRKQRDNIIDNHINGKPLIQPITKESNTVINNGNPLKKKHAFTKSRENHKVPSYMYASVIEKEPNFKVEF